MGARDIVVIGGGLSGLTTAYLLAGRGLNVTLLEAEDRPGGQARAFIIDGHIVEHGSHAFFGYYDTTVNLLEELGTLDMCERIPGWTIVDAYGRRATIQQSPWLPRLVSVVPSMLTVPWLGLRDKFRLLFAALRIIQIPEEELNEVDQKTAFELGTEYGYSDIGVWSWNSASLGLTNLFVNEQSGAIFAGKHKVLIGTDSGLSYLLPKGDLSDILANPLRKACATRGTNVIVNAKATSIERMGSLPDQHQARVTYEQGGETHSVEAHHVIVALQPWDAAPLITWRKDPWMDLQRVTPVITMTLGLSGRIEASTDGREYGFSREQWAFSVVTDLSRLFPRYRGDKTVLRVEVGHADRLPGGLQMDEAELLRLVKQDLDRFWPEAVPMHIEFAKMNREAKHLYVSWTRGQFSKKPTPAQRDLGSGIFLCGDWTTVGTIGMEAACNSAYEAANHVLEQRGLQPYKFKNVML
jgi:protoporphyrinogen oxidase